MKAHDTDPFLICHGLEAPKHDRRCGLWWEGASTSELLAEPNPKSPAWLATVAARLLVASSAPLLIVSGGATASSRGAIATPTSNPVDGPRTRLDAAGWFAIDSRDIEKADLAAARASCWPAYDAVKALAIGAGSLAPQLVLVGEKDPYDKVPFFSRSGIWLFRALRELGHDELNCYVTNARSKVGRALNSELLALHSAFGPYAPTWVGLGQDAHEVLAALSIEHVWHEHPAKARRFSFNAGPQGYASQLFRAGVPVGNFRHGPELATTPEANAKLTATNASRPPLPVSDPGTVLAERCALPLSTTYRQETTDPAKAKRGIDEVKAEAARRLYVTGEAPTLKAAAASSGIKPQAVSKLAGLEDWRGERTKHLATVRDQAKRKAVETESISIAECRTLAWAATVKALQITAKQLEDPNANPRAQDVKALGDLAIRLSESADPNADAERARLHALTPPEILKELQAVMKNQFGIEDGK